ncbi:MAG TPA: GNAT family N-acetyltransferase [Acidimicrobiales bacterium]
MAAHLSEADLGHRNLIAYSKVLTGWCDGGGLLEREGVLAYAGGSWVPVVCNGVFRTDDGVAPEVVLDLAEEFFTERRRGYSLKLRDSGPEDDLMVACEARGLAAFGEPAPEMVCRAPLPVPALPEGVELRPVVNIEGVRDFCLVNGIAYGTYGMPAEVTDAMFSRPEAVLADPDTAIVVAYRGGEALATAMVFCSDGVASLQWVGTLPDARGLGLGQAVTVWTTNEAFRRGASVCTLQASTMGEPLYRALGYESLYHYREFVRWRRPPPGAVES